MGRSRITRLGLASMFLGAILYFGWLLWWKTRVTKPVDMPVSMSPGHLRTQEFKINLEAVYLIEITADQNKIPSDTLFCLLGYTLRDSQCPNTPSVVEASWVLSSEGAVVAKGSSKDQDSGGGSVMNDGIGRAIGSFDGEVGRRYILDVDVLADGTKLAPGNPRLQVQEFPWTPASTVVLIYLVFALELAGIFLLIVAGVRRWRVER